MVRTKADGASSGASRKVVAARAPRKALGSNSAGPSSSSGESPSSSKYGGGNVACPRPTPDWQKDISAFFGDGKKEKKTSDSDDLGCSSLEPAGGSSTTESGSSSKCSNGSNSDTEVIE